MFDLNQSVVDWVHTLRRSDAVSAEDAGELESHLRDLVRDLCKRGLDEQEAFAIASMRIGKHSELQAEFSKLNPAAAWRIRVLWMICGFLAFTIGSAVIRAIAEVISTGAAISGGNPAMVATTATGISAIGWAALFLLAFRLSCCDTAPSDRVPWRWAIIASGGLLISHALRQGSTLVRARSIPLEDVGEIALWQMVGGLVLQVAVLVTCFCFVLKLRNPSLNRSEISSY